MGNEMALKPGDGLDKWEIAVAKRVVGEFRRRSRILRREEFDDLVQDCLLHWIGVRRKLAPDPDEPPVGYMAQVLRNKLTDLMREQGAEKRAGDLGAVSLDATVDGSEDGTTLADGPLAAGRCAGATVSGAATATSSETLAPSEVPPTTACGIPRWSSSAITSRA
jgi:RNA polymerase sigma-70 factor (ECF subfamily)